MKSKDQSERRWGGQKRIHLGFLDRREATESVSDPDILLIYTSNKPHRAAIKTRRESKTHYYIAS